jgi:tetratricopeptide (TPR) repeat protein
MHPGRSSKWLTWLAAIAVFFCGCRARQESRADDFLRLSNVGKAQFDRGDATLAAATFEKALQLNPANSDAKLNLANTLLLLDRNEEALKLARSVFDQDRNAAAAYYVAGMAENHQRHFSDAIKLLTEAKQIDITVNAVSFQLGLAYEGVTNYDAAIEQYEEIEKFAPDFPGIHYRIAQAYIRKGRADDAARQMDLHRDWLAKHPKQALTASAVERCKYTEARVPFTLEQPDPRGNQVHFVDVSASAFAAKYSGPVGVLDFASDGHNHLLVRDGDSFPHERPVVRIHQRWNLFAMVGR